MRIRTCCCIESEALRNKMCLNLWSNAVTWTDNWTSLAIAASLHIWYYVLHVLSVDWSPIRSLPVPLHSHFIFALIWIYTFSTFAIWRRIFRTHICTALTYPRRRPSSRIRWSWYLSVLYFIFDFLIFSLQHRTEILDKTLFHRVCFHFTTFPFRSKWIGCFRFSFFFHSLCLKYSE